MGGTTKMKMKLAVDRSKNRVLFADAGSDVAEILLSLLTVPLSTLHLIAGPSSSPVCLTNLCNSVNHLRNSELLKADAFHGTPLMPILSDDLRLCKSPCNYNECKCCDALARLLHVHADTEAFLRGKERFIITDDWRIKPASTTSLMSLGQMFGTGRIGHDFEEVEVCVGWAEVLSMVKASLSSDTIFTNVFLSKGADDDHSAPQVTMKPGINRNVVHPCSRENSDPSLECKVEFFYDMREKKVMYAECDHGFVDVLLGFLTYPLCRVIKNGDVAGTSLLSRSLNNLYSSATDLGATGFLMGRFLEESTLLDPGLVPFPELVEDRKYIVEDDLLIHQASAMLVMKHWSRKCRTHVQEISITIRKHEAVAALMQAVFTSKMALTDAFVSRKETMQIFVRIETGKTITVDEVKSSDTIAVIRRKIEDKEFIPPEHLYRLTFNCSLLEDSCTVADCDIFDGHTIHLRYLYGFRPCP
ncbi:hypothetical protein ACQ4PT_070735 [Festuca glaucescens]